MSGYTFSTRLPDPDYTRGFWGAGAASAASAATADHGPGFSSVKITSDQKVMVSRTNSQRVLAKAIAGQKWNIDIGYHPMTQDEFRPIDAFLQSRQGALSPFFVALPQYNNPKNTNWKNTLTNSDNSINGGNPFTFTAASAHLAGATSIEITGSNSWTISTFGGSAHLNIPLVGEIFTISDSNDTNHTKAYMITHVETNTTYASDTSRPSANGLRLGISPPLAKNVSTSGTLKFINPLFIVILPTAVRSYSLDTDNLYKFNLKLEEYL